jgi:hypothetical protein
MKLPPLKVFLYALFIIGVSVHSFFYYKGKLKLSSEQETRRKKIISEYGEIVLAFSIIASICGLLLLLTIYEDILHSLGF